MTTLTTRILDLWWREELDHDDLWWRVPNVEDDEVEWWTMCSDFFAWGGGDAEGLTEESLPDLTQAITDIKTIDSTEVSWAGRLYAARRRKMRPQGAYYEQIPEVLWPLFDACGPEREVGLSNPHPHPPTDTARSPA